MILSSIRSRIIAGVLLALLPIIALPAGYLLDWVERSHMESLSQTLLAESRLISHLAEQFMESGTAESAEQLADRSSRYLGRPVTLAYLAEVTSAASGPGFEDDSVSIAQPEIQDALSSGQGSATRYSETLQKDTLYVASRIGPANRPLGVARVAQPLDEINQLRRIVRQTFVATALVAVAITFGIAIWLAAGISRPISQMASVAERMRKGDLSARITFLDKPTDELLHLARTLNAMSSELSDTVKKLEEEKRKLEAIFSKSEDAIMVIDAEGRIQMLNPVASSMLASKTGQAVGRTVIEATLSHDLAELAERVLRTRLPASLAMALAPAKREVNVSVVPLETTSTPGAVIVMHDLTEERRIDAMRRDFIANMSHEIRTPLASIKAMAETILLRGPSDARMAQDYAATIAAETDRLVRITEDLLDLSSIEAGRRPMQRENILLSDAFRYVTERHLPAADDKQLTVDTSGVGDCTVYADKESFHQALANLLDNAITYTPGGGRVSVSAAASNGGMRVMVADTGIGIAEEELPRIFERFYRVDRGRSRASGGTGLGLSIVKHIMESHGGEVSVDSQLGQGSVFTMFFPNGPGSGQSG